MYKFAAAYENELIVFGSEKPKYSNKAVNQWIDFMQSQNIKRVCCLLSQIELTRYLDLLETYQQKFGLDQVCWAPIEDFQFSDRATLIEKILPFLMAANKQDEKVVVHCAGGVGRTGHVLAAWLVSGRGFSNKDAIAAVKRTGRNPHEAVIVAMLKGQNPWKVVAQLNSLLDASRQNSF
ncbi:dual specificity protein phosphatase [Gloeocapsa sp. PCC 7428]|uniref:protein-tyrosine phosphatase family protein n=1 Tax=Gloeocapsa sp. PCC 7428 TaxID=1173026 RepID=UPI0002A5C1EF|nr:dual specificity protein phosphatase family protein [Gloeocapsa sp. PCC 7428]AFZ32488.1 dual specificity protein phosphatase [Gloeocapsa sp. PCC 7428]